MKGVDEEPCIFLILASIALLLRWKYSFFPHKRNLSGLAEFFWNLVRHLLICLRMGWWLWKPELWQFRAFWVLWSCYLIVCLKWIMSVFFQSFLISLTRNSTPTLRIWRLRCLPRDPPRDTAGVDHTCRQSLLQSVAQSKMLSMERRQAPVMVYFICWLSWATVCTYLAKHYSSWTPSS